MNGAARALAPPYSPVMVEPEKQETLVELVVPPGYRESDRLDVYLTRFLPNASRAKVQRGIKDGRVTIEGRVESRPSRVSPRTPTHEPVAVCGSPSKVTS